MSAALKILVYLIGTVVMGATLAPWLFWAGQYISHFQQLSFLAGTDFRRYFDRSILISAFFLLIPVLRWIGLRRLKSLGLRKNARRVSHLLGGFALALATVSALGAFLFGIDVFELKDPVPWNLLPPVLLTAISVAIIEETLFRGALLGLFRQTLTPQPAAILVSALFSILHFLNPEREGNVAVHWYSGFELLPGAFWRFSDPLALLGGFIAIGILGLLLAHATIRTSSLWLAIGIHSGLIFGKMGFNKVMKRVQDVTPWFGSDITVGIGAILILLFLWSLVWLIYLRGEPDANLA
ncbi:MAG: CPBP family intramembrane metalloprotease [Verrucomicrobia bacterium]|nr:CPBP family intramembrane metalloprotease [Verrucomicrobiota bacterium]